MADDGEAVFEEHAVLYGAREEGESMKVKELMTWLEEFDEDEEVNVYDFNSGKESPITEVVDHWFTGGVTININGERY